MKKNFKKILGTMLSLTMVLGLLAGCGAEEVENSVSSEAGEVVSQEDGVSYPIDTDETLSIALLNDAAVSAVSKDITATPFAKAWQEQTGVEIEFVICENASAMQLLFADGDLPDIVIWKAYDYAGGPAKAIEDGIMEPLTWEEIETYAPDYAKILTEGHPDIARTYKTDNGDYIGFGQLPCSNYYRNASGMTLRADWLKEWGMEIPDTLEELEAYLTKSLEVEGMVTPFSSAHLIAPVENGYWTSPFGLVCADLYQVDGVIHAGYAEPGYKDFLAWCRSLVEKGLMDSSFTYLEKDVYSDSTAVWHAALGGGIGTYVAYAEDPSNGLDGFDVIGMPPIAGEDGVAMGGGTTLTSGPAGVRIAWITPQCDNKELALKFLNYGYTEAGNLLFNFGVEGESYTMVDGVPTYTEWITNNPDGLSMQYAMAQYNRAAVGGGPFQQSDDYGRQYFARPQQVACSEEWNKTDAHLYNVPVFTVAEEDTSEYATLGADIETFVAEARVHFVDGTWSLDDYETLYIDQLKKMGLDRYLEIIQDSLDRFYAR